MFEIAKILKPHGIKGALKVFPLTTEKDRFKKGDKYFIDNKEYTVESIGKLGKCLIIKFLNIDDRNTAELFRDKIIEIEDKDLIPLKKDEYYVHDLLKSKVYDIENNFMGSIEEIIFIKDNNVLDLKREDGSALTILFKKEFIEKIDIENKKIILKYKKEYYEY